MTGSVVVSGAGSGLGEAIARCAAARGWTVGVLDRDGDAAQRVASAIGTSAPGATAVALIADTTVETQVDAAFETFAAATGQAAPDGVVANAGIVRFGPLASLSLDEWRAVIAVNLTGTFVTARAAATRMIAAGQPGSIVTVTSMNGVAPGPNAGAYGASKAAVALLTQQMALEWGPAGIRCNAVAPGLIDAGMSEPIYADPDIRAQRAGRVPLGRLGRADEVATTVMFLLSDDAAYVTGTELLVDGGVARSVISTLPRPRTVDSVGTDSTVDSVGTDEA